MIRAHAAARLVGLGRPAYPLPQERPAPIRPSNPGKGAIVYGPKKGLWYDVNVGIKNPLPVKR